MRLTRHRRVSWGGRVSSVGVNSHPLVRAWFRRHPGVPFGQQPDDPGVRELVDQLRLGPVGPSLGGDDNLTVAVDSGRFVLRTYKPFVTRTRVIDVQRLRAGLRAAGLITPVPIMIYGRSVFRCDRRWAEVEPYLELPERPGSVDQRSLFRGLGRLHRVLARLPRPSTQPVRRSFVDPRILRRWLTANAAIGVLPTDRAEELGALITKLRSRWVRSDALPMQTVHTDPHTGNLIPTEDGRLVYLDFTDAEFAPRVHDLAVAVAYLQAGQGSDAELIDRELPGWLDAYDDGSGTPLSGLERQALPGYTAAVGLYYDICDWGRGWRRIARRLL
jgi:Ser/Thr protein kinase RdoA (MazF antagonist)